MELMEKGTVSQGEYRKTEIGRIPHDWRLDKLQSLGSFKKGKNIPKKDLKNEGLPCILYGEIYTKDDVKNNL